jgi:D-glycero-D-manno-heptose 1,7-bisphosphate phosphatase
MTSLPPRGYPAVFLDRDGVLNRCVMRDERPHPPASLAELEILPGVREALRALKANRFLTLVATNQPDVARGTILQSQVEEINLHLGGRLALDHFFVCYHDDADGCDCRKPRPGLLLRAARLLEIDLAASYMVGDRWRDIEAGKSAGCRTILIDYGYSERPGTLWVAQPPDAIAGSLAAAVAWILQDQIRGVAA